MSHDYHVGPEGAVIFDGCGECDSRVAKPLDGLLTLDADRFETLRARMISVELTDSSEPFYYLTDNEAKLGTALYRIHVLLERHGRGGLR